MCNFQVTSNYKGLKVAKARRFRDFLHATATGHLSFPRIGSPHLVTDEHDYFLYHRSTGDSCGPPRNQRSHNAITDSNAA